MINSFCLFISLWLWLHDHQTKSLLPNQKVQSEQSKRMGRRREQEVVTQLRAKVTSWSWCWSSYVVSAGETGWSANRTERWSTAPLKPDTGAGGHTHTETPHLNTHTTCLTLFLCLSFFSWTKDRRVLLVKSHERKKWVSVRPVPYAKTFPQQYDVSENNSFTLFDAQLRWG